MSCFVVLFSVLFRLQLSVVRPKRSQVARIELPCISVSRRTKTQKYEGAYSNNLRAVGPSHAQLKMKQNRKQDNKTRHRDQNKVNK